MRKILFCSKQKERWSDENEGRCPVHGRATPVIEQITLEAPHRGEVLVRIDGMISHIVPVEELEGVFERLRNGDGVRTILRFD